MGGFGAGKGRLELFCASRHSIGSGHNKHTPDEDAMSMSDEDRRRIGPGFQVDMSGFGYELDEDAE
jgi:hypothetical protein